MTAGLVAWHRDNSLADGLDHAVLLKLAERADHRGHVTILDKIGFALDYAQSNSCSHLDVLAAFRNLRTLGEIEWIPTTGTWTFPTYPVSDPTGSDDES